ncbi:MAG: ABC transporter substrate binding protein, partial [Gallionellaceae bacterium]|nr:ABC transporter substrate binding protein [Gallionellaceae bacterium]
MPLASQAEPLRVTILLSEEGAVYRAFAEFFAVEAARQNTGFKITQANVLSPETDFVVAVGAKSVAVAANSRAPILAVLVSKAGFEKSLHEVAVQRDKKTISAIYIDQPIKRQLGFIAAALPEVKKIGVMFSAVSSDIVNLRKAVVGTRFSLIESQLASSEALHRQLSWLLDESEVLLVTPDAQVYNPTTLRNILIDSYQHNVPMVGISPSYVRAGALGAVFTTPEQFALQAVSIVRHFSVEGHLVAPQYPTQFELMFNTQVARSMNIRLKENSEIVNKI